MSDIDAIVKAQGFDGVKDFNYLTGMLIHEAGVEQFYSWRNEDGTKSGLLKLLNISPRVEMVSIPNTEYEALIHERDGLRAALQEIVEIGATWREQLPGADEFFVGMFAIGRMRGVAEKALGIPLEGTNPNGD